MARSTRSVGAVHPKTRRGGRHTCRTQASPAPTAKPATTLYGQPITPPLDTLEETAREDALLAAWAIHFASDAGIFGNRGFPGAQLAAHCYRACGFQPDKWAALVASFMGGARSELWTDIALADGPAAAQAAIAEYGAVFAPELEAEVHGTRQFPKPLPSWLDRSRIEPWLQLLASMESDARPSLLRRIFGRRG